MREETVSQRELEEEMASLLIDPFPVPSKIPSHLVAAFEYARNISRATGGSGSPSLAGSIYATKRNRLVWSER